MVKVEKLSDEYIYDDDSYFADYKYVTNSMLKNIKGGTTHNLEHYINSTFPSSLALVLGSAFHCYFLEPLEFPKRYIWTPKIDRRTTAGKLAYKNYVEASGGLEPICETYKVKFEAMEDNLLAHPLVRGIMDGAETETIHFWKDVETGRLCKGKVDIEKGSLLADLKTTSEIKGASPWKFEEFREKWAVEQQGAFYLDGTQKKEFYFIMVELKAPHNIGVYKLSDKSIARGREDYRSQLKDYDTYINDEVCTFYNNNKALEV
tara:strand:- start:14478 stop:15263 length:786 start_codon:yes stop_codon:yes gene_type:complete